MPFDISKLGIAETLRCSAQLRTAAEGHPTLEAAARGVCSFFYDSFVDSSGRRTNALVRFYITHPYGKLPPEERDFARRLLPGDVVPWPELRCLTLLGTRGETAAWNNRQLSQGHRAIPLPSPQVVEGAPMIAQLFKQMGADIADIVRPAPAMLANPEKQTYNVFHVPDAKGSPHIPAQAEFVGKFRIGSVVGFGGALSWGELFSVIIFSHAHIPEVAASRFRTLALDVRSKLRSLDATQVFEPARDTGPVPVIATTTAPARTGPSRVDPTPTGDPTSFRVFHDSRGIKWKVWAVVPTLEEIASITTTRRTLRNENDHWQRGWLLFESDTESRRLRPIPKAWQSATLTDLDAMCRQAKTVRSLDE
jgi:hypothetical protein